ncbi:MAG: small multi-drug export protein [Firmicutes bacterium]|nr:small multi-drug export protein [Bacillota bacterium]
MVQSLVQWFVDTLTGIPKDIVCFIISMVPILELRGGMIAAALFKLSWLRALAFCILGNMLPMPFVLLLIDKIFELLKKTKMFRPIVEKLEKRAMGQRERIEKYEFWGLVLFVGIPLPGTGGWTGSLAAALMGLRFRKAFPAVILGILLAATIMSVATYVIPWLVRIL